SGASGFVVNNDVAYELGIARYQKISTRPDTYLVPVSIPNTPVKKKSTTTTTTTSLIEHSLAFGSCCLNL
ncbi:MAG: hypothetical protein WBF33_32990, partial [Candidatus Nitrosopolaris sp.]